MCTASGAAEAQRVGGVGKMTSREGDLMIHDAMGNGINNDIICS